MAHRSNHDRQEKQVEELEAVHGLGPDDNPERDGDEQNVQQDLRDERARKPKGRSAGIQDETQCQRRHYGNSDSVPDEKWHKRNENIAKIDLCIG